VPTALKRRLGVSVDAIREREGRELAPTGLNVVGKSEESVRVSHDARLAINVNRPDDALVAEEFIESPGEP
jgi:adenosylcobinamide-phosphate guanylyltransferase